jgi:hypothetical protein
MRNLTEERPLVLNGKMRFRVVLPAIALAASLLVVSGGGSVASGAAKSTGAATCNQVTKAQIQPLMSTPITKVKITKDSSTGQQCVYSSASGGAAIDVRIVKGGFAKQSFQEEVVSFSRNIAVPGVGQKTLRANGDYQIDSLSGNEYCSVSVAGATTVPGVAALENAANGSKIPESANAIIASALGTICNRLYKKGTTTPSLAGLATPAGSAP